MTCRFCRRRIHKTREGFWSDGQGMPTFCGYSQREAGHRYHDPEPTPKPMISWAELDAANASESEKLVAWPRVLERLRSAERAASLLFLMVMFIAAVYLTDLLTRMRHGM